MRVFGLIGFPLSHSFSADYFNTKFRSLNLDNCIFKLFPINDISEFKKLLKSEPDICGLSVTIPYKQKIIPFLDDISAEAKEINAINCIAFEKGKLNGYNTDCSGFERSFIKEITEASSPAMILGNGGASKAVQYVLKKHSVDFILVSRFKSDSTIPYEEITDEIIDRHKIIINTTPLGMFPKTADLPLINYQALKPKHILIDLIYNPEQTAFLKKGSEIGCRTYNGLPMLHLQAEKSWEIWNPK